MAKARNITPQTPGEPLVETQFDAQDADQAPAEVADAEPASDPAADPQPETTSQTVDQEPVIDRRDGELPQASDIDPTNINQPVLTQQGWVVPA